MDASALAATEQSCAHWSSQRASHTTAATDAAAVVAVHFAVALAGPHRCIGLALRLSHADSTTTAHVAACFSVVLGVCSSLSCTCRLCFLCFFVCGRCCCGSFPQSQSIH